MVVLNGIPLTRISSCGHQGLWRPIRMGERQDRAALRIGLGWAGNTPFQWGKQVASHLGGTRDPMVIRWPRTMTDKGGLRSHFIHVTDIVPTLLDAAGVPAPTGRRHAADGDARASLPSDPDRSKAPSRHTQQYFEVLGNRAMYKDGWWLACRIPRIPWKLDQARPRPFRARTLGSRCRPVRALRPEFDFSQAHDLAANIRQSGGAAPSSGRRQNDIRSCRCSAACLRLRPVPEAAAKTSHFEYHPGPEPSPGMIPPSIIAPSPSRRISR